MTIKMKIVKRYIETNLPEIYELNGIEFRWTDWVLCKVKLYQSNVKHWVIASSFRGNTIDDFSCTLINPTYDHTMDGVLIKELDSLEAVKIIEEPRDQFPE